MKVILTGSTGHISKPLAVELIEKEQQLTVISSKAEKQKEIENLGATAAIGSLYDANFLKGAFAGADVAYCMVPPPEFHQPLQKILDGYVNIVENYKEAIMHAGVKKVVILSTVGAHMDKGNGLLCYANLIEKLYNRLPKEVHIKTMRPVGFYYNLLAFIPQIKRQGQIASNYGGNVSKPWVSPKDIAAAIAEAILSPFKTREIKYISSEELTCNQIARILGVEIGQPDLRWNIMTDEQMLSNFKQMGMDSTTAEAMVEMNASMNSGILYEDYQRHEPYRGKVTMAEFAKQFAQIFNQ